MGGVVPRRLVSGRRLPVQALASEDPPSQPHSGAGRDCKCQAEHRGRLPPFSVEEKKHLPIMKVGVG